jgi:hypothetical protein
MTKYTERLMSRASVAAMAAFAPKSDPASTIPNFAERVDDNAAGGGGDDDLLDGLSAEEQAQFAAMNGGKPAGDQGNVDPAGDGAGEGDDDGTDPELDGGADGPDDPAGAVDDRADGTDAGKPDAQASDKRPAPKTVSYGKYQRELAKAQKERDEFAAKYDGATKETVKEREERIKLNERTRLLLEAINTKQPAAAAAETEDKDPEPDKDSDPLGHLEWRNRKLENTVNEMRTGRQQEQQVTAAEREEQQVYGAFSADLERAAGADPTFADAFVHLRETRYRELGFIYADIDITDTAQVATLSGPEQAALSQNIKKAFYNEQIMVARGAMQAGKSPAKVVENLARARGFVPKAAAAAPDAAAAAGSGAAKPRNGAAPPARVEAAPQGTVSDQLEQIRQNAAASRSLSDAGGSPGGDLTPERLVAMDDDEFEQLVATMPKGRLDKLMGKGPGQ